MRLLSISFIFLSALIFSSVYFEGIKRSEAKVQPNIILVITDDQGYGDLACHGHPFIKTPYLDKLHAQSTRFTDFQVSPTCSPTRGALMSGKAPFRVGITHTVLERERMALSATTIAEVLREAGYTTGIFGKWHLGDADPYQPENRGFDEVFIHAAGGIGQNLLGTQGDVPGTGYFNPIIKHNRVFKRTDGYCTDVFFQQALGWMKKVKGKRPFFAYISTNAPHGPFIAPEEYAALYKEKCAEYNIPEKRRDQVVHFLGMITNIDENMGLLMKKLDEWDLSKNTALIFMTDNGTARGFYIYNAGMKGAKGSNHEGGTRVPFFIRYPGVADAGAEVDRLARHYDLFPTLAQIAGAQIPKDLELDGRSLVALIKDPKASWPDRLTYFHCGRWGKAGAKRWDNPPVGPDAGKYQKFAVRNEEWRLIGDLGKNSESPVLELYHLAEDPGETQNLIDDHREVAQTMMAGFENWWAEVRPLLVNEDASLEAGKPFIEAFEKQKAETGITEWKRPDIYLE